MPKSSKRAVAPEPPAAPQVGDKVKPGASEMVYEVSRVSPDGLEVDLHVPGMNLQRFRVRTETLTFVERKPAVRTSNPFTNPEPAIDLGEVLERVRTVERENLQRLKDDIAILKAYLKTQGAPKATISALEALTVDQHKSWKTAVERIEELLDD